MRGGKKSKQSECKKELAADINTLQKGWSRKPVNRPISDLGEGRAKDRRKQGRQGQVWGAVRPGAVAPSPEKHAANGKWT